MIAFKHFLVDGEDTTVTTIGMGSWVTTALCYDWQGRLLLLVVLLRRPIIAQKTIRPIKMSFLAQFTLSYSCLPYVT